MSVASVSIATAVSACMRLMPAGASDRAGSNRKFVPRWLIGFAGAATLRLGGNHRAPIPQRVQMFVWQREPPSMRNVRDHGTA